MKCSECRENPVAVGSKYCDTCKNATKLCSIGGERKSIFDFEKNQRRISGSVSRRGGCKECRKLSKKPLTPKARKEYEELHDKPEIGDPFLCPICDKIFEQQYTNEVTLDHDHASGRIRGYICRNCNTAMGLMDDKPTILDRAARWLRGTLTSLF